MSGQQPGPRGGGLEDHDRPDHQRDQLPDLPASAGPGGALGGGAVHGAGGGRLSRRGAHPLLALPPPGGGGEAEQPSGLHDRPQPGHPAGQGYPHLRHRPLAHRAVRQIRPAVPGLLRQKLPLLPVGRPAGPGAGPGPERRGLRPAHRHGHPGGADGGGVRALLHRGERLCPVGDGHIRPAGHPPPAEPGAVHPPGGDGDGGALPV